MRTEGTLGKFLSIAASTLVFGALATKPAAAIVVAPSVVNYIFTGNVDNTTQTDLCFNFQDIQCDIVVLNECLHVPAGQCVALTPESVCLTVGDCETLAVSGFTSVPGCLVCVSPCSTNFTACPGTADSMPFTFTIIPSDPTGNFNAVPAATGLPETSGAVLLGSMLGLAALRKSLAG